MTMPQTTCPDCQLEMEIGFIPDFTHGGTLQTGWHPGAPEDWTIFGMKSGSVKVDRKTTLPIFAFRCPNCGRLQFHAIPRKTEE